MSLSTAAELEDTKARNKQLINEVLEAYPEKYAKRRAKHLGTFEAPMPAPRASCGARSRT